MFEALIKIFCREWALLRCQPSQWIQPWVFLCFMAVMPAIMVGETLKSSPLLSATLIYLAVVFSSMLTLDKALKEDHDNGTFTQWILSPWPLWWLMLAKTLAHWLFWVAPMILISPVIMIMLGFKLDMLIIMALGLLIGTPLLSFVGVMTSALTLGLHASGFLVALIMLPLIMPMLLLSLSPVQSLLLGSDIGGSIALLGALTILTSVLCPLACAFGVKVSQSCGNS